MARMPFLPQYGGWSWGLYTDLIPADMKALISKPLLDWAYVEHNLALLLGFLLKADAPAVAALFSTLRQGRNQREAIRLAAEAAVADLADRHLIQATLALLKTAEAARNDMAHGCWGELRSSPSDGNIVQADKVVWIEAKHYSPVNLTAVVSNLSGGEFRPPHRAIERFLFIYQRQDLIDVGALVELAFTATYHLLNMLSQQARGAPSDHLDPSRDWLCSQPRIREALDNLGAGHSSQQGRP